MFKNEKDKKFKDGETPLLVFMHGNAGNIGLRLPYFTHIINRLGVNVLAMAYRSYSNSDLTKKPNDEGLKMDADSIIQFLSAPE